jgi:hypothetical protein
MSSGHSVSRRGRRSAGKHTARMSTKRGTNTFGFVDLTHMRARTTLNGSAEASIDPRPAECRVAVRAHPGDDRAHDPCVDVRIFRPRLHLRSRSRSRYVPYAPYADRCGPLPVARNPERFGHCVVVVRAADVADDLHCGVSRRRGAVYDSLFFNGASGLDRPARTATTPQLVPLPSQRHSNSRADVTSVEVEWRM